MPILLSLLSNKYVWLILVIAALVGGAWFKIHSLSSQLEEQVTANDLLKATNATLKQNLDMAISVNKANTDAVESLRQDQANAADSLTTLATNLAATKQTLNQARKKLAESTAQKVAVPQSIVDTVITIQDTRTDQAAKDKALEALP